MTESTEVTLYPATVPHGNGKGALSKSIMRNAEGTVFYCAGDQDGPCPTAYTADNFSSVMSHRSGRHGKLKAEHKAAKSRSASLDNLLIRAKALTQDIETVLANNPYEAENAALKRRAAAAERNLRTIKRALS